MQEVQATGLAVIAAAVAVWTVLHLRPVAALLWTPLRAAGSRLAELALCAGFLLFLGPLLLALIVDTVMRQFS